MLEKINSPEDVKKLKKEEKRKISTRIKRIYIRNCFKKWRSFSIKFRSHRTNNCVT